MVRQPLFQPALIFQIEFVGDPLALTPKPLQCAPAMVFDVFVEERQIAPLLVAIRRQLVS